MRPPFGGTGALRRGIAGRTQSGRAEIHRATARGLRQPELTLRLVGVNRWNFPTLDQSFKGTARVGRRRPENRRFVVESHMTATPRELLDTSIAQLQALSAFLGDQLGVVTARSDSAAELRACEEILVS